MIAGKVSTIKPADFDERWARWLEEVHNVKNHIEIETIIDTEWGQEIRFYYDSVANTKIYAILYYNKWHDKPVFAYYHGHNSDVFDQWNVWHAKNLLDAGYSVCSIDMRFQSKKIDDQNYYNNKEYPSACYNILDLETCYNKRLDQDALKIIDILSDENCFECLKGKPVFVAGPSQGGGLSLMVASFDNRVKCCLADLPSDCAIKDRITGRYGKYGVIMDYINDHPEQKEEVMKNQDYFDVINMTDKIECPVISSIGTADEICPPRFYMVAYEKIKTEKGLFEYPGYGHGGFEEKHIPIKFCFADKISGNLR